MRSRAVGLVAAVLIMVTPGVAGAEPAAGVLGSTELVTFDTATPAIVAARPITGLQSMNEDVIGMAVRPSTGQVFIVTVPIGVVGSALVRSYTLDVNTGAATFVGSIPNTVPGAADVASGVDFNPRVDRIRVVNANDENFRINPNNGALSGDDVNLNPSGQSVIAAAYDRNAPGDTGLPTLYGISAASSSLVTIGGLGGIAPGGVNGGSVQMLFGPLGVTVAAGSDAGLDVSATTGVAYATIRTAGGSALYTINLSTGAATPVGAFPVDVKDLTILPPAPPVPPAPPPAPPAQPAGPPAPRDKTAPHVLIDASGSAKLKTLKRGRFKFRFSCDEACKANAKLRSGRTALASGSSSLTAAGVGSIRLSLTKKGAKALRGRRKALRGKLSLTFVDGAGHSTVLSRRLLLVP
jgi:Domain of unknown function (DUF4394)